MTRRGAYRFVFRKGESMRAFVAGCVLAFVAVVARGESFSFDEKPGEFAVGFKVVQQYDGTRTYLGRYDTTTGEPITKNRARPIQTLIWYPAAKSGDRLHYGDYLILTGSEDDFTRSAEQIANVSEFRLRDFIPRDMPASAIDAIKHQPMWATRDAAPAAGKFPVAVYAPSHNESAAENADLCEFLASHGYVVIASPSFGANNRWMGLRLSDVETQASDIEFLVGYAATLSDADASRIAVIGYSWGGVANVFAAARDSRIAALVGLEGGIRLVGKLVAAAPYVTPENVTVPYLYLSARPISTEDLFRQEQDLSGDLLARLKYADLFVVTLEPLVHYEFASKHLRFLDTNEPIVFPGDYSLTETYQAYAWLARYTLAFLDAELKHDANAANWLVRSPEANGLPAHQVRLEVNRGKGIAPTREAIAAELHRRGFAHAREVFTELREQDAKFKFPPEEFADWIENLQTQRRYDEVIAIATEFAATYPDRPGPLVRIGDAYRSKGETTRAIEFYKKALAIDPHNAVAQAGLQKATGKTN
jgi:tetratricopeptide (TPR) repeat protein